MCLVYKWAEGKKKTDDKLPILIFKLANAFFFFLLLYPSPVTALICCYVKE